MKQYLYFCNYSGRSPPNPHKFLQKLDQNLNCENL